jgi:hypothetical protein
VTPLLCASWVAGILSRGEIMSSLQSAVSTGYHFACFVATKSITVPQCAGALLTDAYVSDYCIVLVISDTHCT